ncbi:hypothetical protein ACHAWF_005786, partial [Thalassiosira exigua]
MQLARRPGGKSTEEAAEERLATHTDTETETKTAACTIPSPWRPRTTKGRDDATNAVAPWTPAPGSEASVDERRRPRARAGGPPKSTSAAAGVKSILFVAVLSFVGVVVFDGLIHFAPRTVERSAERVADAAEGAAGGSARGGRERRPIDEVYPRRDDAGGGGLAAMDDRSEAEGEREARGEGGREALRKEGAAGRFLRRMADALFDSDAPSHRSYESEEGEGYEDYGTIIVAIPTTTTNPSRRLLHPLPLLPKRALQHRRRRELMERRRPIPEDLREGAEDELYRADHERRRRRRMQGGTVGGEEDAGLGIYETGLYTAQGGILVCAIPSFWISCSRRHRSPRPFENSALYQGYGTHYLDLWVGSPPQRQTVIVDTGSSVTAFPCTGCKNCGSDPATGTRYHLDEDFDVDASSTYEEGSCKRGHMENGRMVGGTPCRIGSCVAKAANGSEGRGQSCQVSVAYAEGSTWSAVEGNDVAYPAGPHDAGLEGREERLAAGVGAGMGSFAADDADGGGGTKERDFDWMDFRLDFGCQKKVSGWRSFRTLPLRLASALGVSLHASRLPPNLRRSSSPSSQVTGLFRTQLEDGIMGMDNRRGAFWLQLRKHYERNGYSASKVRDRRLEAGAEDVGPGPEGDAAAFDPAQFSLCYDRQPLSLDLTPGVGSGALTLGGTDRLLHLTKMAYAENVAPHGGWYPVRIKALFLRSGGGTLAVHPPSDAPYVRVQAEESIINGSPQASHGVIVDSGTTDSYLPQALKAPFEAAWREVMGEDQPYHNNARDLTPEQVNSFPTILLVLKGHETNSPDDADAAGLARNHHQMMDSKDPAVVDAVDVVVAIPPAHYLEGSRRDTGKYTARVYFTERYGQQSILGSNFLMGHEVNFDVGKGRIGFAESHCDYERYL